MAGEGRFGHERLDVYRVAIEFVAWAGELIDGALARTRASAVEQMDRASTSIPLNIAEGNGRRSRADHARFLDMAKGSALECAACLDVLVARRKLRAGEAEEGKALLLRVVAMLTKLTERLVS